MGRRSKGLLVAGIIGAAAGMFLMNMMNGSNDRKLGNRGRMMMEGAQRGMFKLGEASRAAFQEGMEMLRH